MMEHPIHTLPPAELRGYARGLRETASLLSLAWVRTGLGSGELAAVVTLTREAWQREADIAEGFAARLDGIEAAPAEEQTLYWRPGWAEQDASPDVFAALAEAEMLQPAALRSTAWEGERWALRLPAGDGQEEIDWFETREEAMAFLADWRTLTTAEPPTSLAAEPEPAAPTPAEAAQEGLAEAVAESLAVPAPNMAEDILASRRETAHAMFLAGKKLREITAETGIPEGSINSWASTLGWRKELAKLQAPAHHAHGRSENGGKFGTWTTERETLLRRLYPSPRPLEEVMQDLNLLPGPAIASPGAVSAQAKKLGLTRRQPPRVDAAIPPPKGTEPEAMTTEDKAEARERLRTGASKGARDIIEWFGCTEAEAQALVDEHRAKMRSAA